MFRSMYLVPTWVLDSELWIVIRSISVCGQSRLFSSISWAIWCQNPWNRTKEKTEEVRNSRTLKSERKTFFLLSCRLYWWIFLDEGLYEIICSCLSLFPDMCMYSVLWNAKRWSWWIKIRRPADLNYDLEFWIRTC